MRFDDKVRVVVTVLLVPMESVRTCVTLYFPAAWAAPVFDLPFHAQE